MRRSKYNEKFRMPCNRFWKTTDILGVFCLFLSSRHPDWIHQSSNTHDNKFKMKMSKCLHRSFFFHWFVCVSWVFELRNPSVGPANRSALSDFVFGLSKTWYTNKSVSFIGVRVLYSIILCYLCITVHKCLCGQVWLDQVRQIAYGESIIVRNFRIKMTISLNTYTT